MERHQVKTEQTLIAFLATKMPGAKKSTLKERIGAGAVEVNGETVRKATWPLQRGDEVVLGGRDRDRAARARIPPLFVDDALYIVDKPSGLLSVAAENEKDKTAQALASLDVGTPLHKVHRLDRETSGVLAFARTKEDRRVVIAQWAASQKTYFAVVTGEMPADHGTIDVPLWEHPTSLQVHAGPHATARDAVTHYVVEQVVAGRSLLKVTLETGRKHQIRVHVASLGCPIVGDARYNSVAQERDYAGGLLLHAARLELPHPRTGAPVVVDSPLPMRLKNAIKAAR